MKRIVPILLACVLSFSVFSSAEAGRLLARDESSFALPLQDAHLNYVEGLSTQMRRNIEKAKSDYRYACDSQENNDFCVQALAKIAVVDARVSSSLLDDLFVLAEVRYLLLNAAAETGASSSRERISEYNHALDAFSTAFAVATTRMDAAASVGTDVSFARGTLNSFDRAISQEGSSSYRNLEVSRYLLTHATAFAEAVSGNQFFSYLARGNQIISHAGFENLEFLFDRSADKLDRAHDLVEAAFSEGVTADAVLFKLAYLDSQLTQARAAIDSGDDIIAMKYIQDISQDATSILSGGYWQKGENDLLTTSVVDTFPQYFFRDVSRVEQNDFAYYLHGITSLDRQIEDREILLNLAPEVRAKLFSLREKAGDSVDYLLRHLHRVPEILRKEYAENRVEVERRADFLEQTFEGLVLEGVATSSQLETVHNMLVPVRNSFNVGDAAKDLFSLLRVAESSFRVADSLEIDSLISYYDQAFVHNMSDSLHDRLSGGYIPFSDVTENGWVIDYVQPLKALGVVKGFADGTFNPDASITRAELLKMALIAFGHSVDVDSQDNGYIDVALHSWQSGVVSRAVSLGIYDEGHGVRFNPNERIGRAEALRAILLASGADVPVASSTDFSDVYEPWQKNFVQYAKDHAIVNGFGDGSFRPNSFISRAEMAKVIANLL